MHACLLVLLLFFKWLALVLLRLGLFDFAQFCLISQFWSVLNGFCQIDDPLFDPF